MLATPQDDVQVEGMRRGECEVEEMWLLGRFVLVYMQYTAKISSVEIILYIQAPLSI